MNQYLLEITNYFLESNMVDEEFGNYVMCRGRGVPVFVNPSVDNLETLRNYDPEGDVRVGIENGTIFCWPASFMMHDEYEKADMKKFNFRATIMHKENLVAAEKSLKYFASVRRRISTPKDDAELRVKMEEHI